MNGFFCKILTITLLVLIVFTSSGLILRPARAIPVEVTADPYPMIASLAAEEIDVAEELLLWLKDEFLMALRDRIVKTLVDMIVQDIVTWIQGDGQPRFIGNWDRFLKTAGDIAFDSVVKEVGLSNICQPFKLNLKFALIPIPRSMPPQLDCTLDKVVSNINNFYKDFQSGGWIGYSTAWRPQNNYFGSLIIAEDEILLRKSEAVRAAQNEGIASKGFLSVKRNIGGTPLENIRDLELEDDQYNALAEYEAQGRTLDDLTDEEYDDLGLTDEQYDALANAKFGEDPVEEIVTPGDVVGEAAAKAIGADQDYIVNVKGIVSAIVNAIINRMIKEGLSLVRNTVSGESSSGNDYNLPDRYGDVSGLTGFDPFQQDVSARVQRLAQALQDYIDVKSQTAQADLDIISAYDRINQTPGCSQISQSQADAINSDLSSLTSEMTVYIPIVGEIENLQTELDSAEQNSAGSMVNLYQRANDFLTRYNYLYMDLVYQSDKITQARNVLTQRQGERASAQQLLNQCLNAASNSGG